MFDTWQGRKCIFMSLLLLLNLNVIKNRLLYLRNLPDFSRIKLLLNQITAISWTYSKTSLDALSSAIHGCTKGWGCGWSYNPPTPPPTDFKTLNKNSTKNNRVFQKHTPKKKFVINLRYPPPKFSTSVHATYAILRELKTWETSQIR